MKLHEKIKFMRSLKKWTQEEVAERLSIAPSTYGSIERGETNIPYNRLEHIAKVFEVDLADLVDSDEVTFFSSVTNHHAPNNYCGHNFSQTHIISANSNELIHEIEKLNLVLSGKNTEIDYLKQQNIELKERTTELREQNIELQKLIASFNLEKIRNKKSHI